MDEKIKDQQKFLHMVVHDLRNPAESIHQGMQIALEMI